jgi:hypothetical protein
MTKPVATIVLSRNLPEVADRLVERFKRYDEDLSDIYLVESGTDSDLVSEHCSYWANWPEATAAGLRYCRGFNYGLTRLLFDGKFGDYDYYFLVCNDAVLGDEPVVGPMLEIMEAHPRIGILSPCSSDWAEQSMIPEDGTRLFPFTNHIAWLLRRDFIDKIRETEIPSYMNFLYDGSNFRGYDADIELIAKAYANDYAVAITRKVMFREDTGLTDRNADLIRTEHMERNQRLMLEEGLAWLRRKYGFNSRWSMLEYVQQLHGKFFENFPQYAELKA